MDLGKDVFPSVFQTPLCGHFQKLNRSVFLWMITMFGANTPESSKMFQKMKVFSH